MPKPIPAILPTTAPAACSSGGPNRFTAASRLTEARLHAAWTFSPITGHSRTDSGGRGTATVWFSKSATSSSVVSATLTVTAPSGTTMSATPRSVISVAASPPRPPSSPRSAAKAG